MSNHQTIFQEECIRCTSKGDRFKSGFDHSKDGLFLFSHETFFLDTNPTFARITQYLRHELISMPLNTLFPKEMDYKDLLSPQRMTWNSPLFFFKTLMRTKDKKECLVSVTISPVPGTQKKDPIFQALVKPKPLHTNAADTQTRERLRSIGDLAGGIAHNFNNIMTAMYGNITLARMELSLETDAIDHLERAENSMNEAVKLTRQLLTFAKGGSPVKEKFNPGPLVRDTTRFNLSGSNVRLEIDLPDRLWPIRADKNQIGQVIDNITINARQAMETGGTLWVHMENTTLLKDNLLTIAKGAYIKITFKDQGKGICEKDLVRIFDPYFTTKTNGDGMGLSICHSIINKHKGHISASSQLGAGTIVCLYLPAEPEENPKERAMTTDNSNSRARILVMDDEEQIRTVTQKMLEKFGYTITLTPDGQEAVAEYQKAFEKDTPYDLVIMDLTVPGGMGGKEASQLILGMDPSANLVVSSGYSDDPVMADYKSYGLKGIIHKPYRLATLKEILGSLIP